MVFALSAVSLLVLLCAAVRVAVMSREKCTDAGERVINKNDIILMCVLCVLTAAMLFTSLGDCEAPESEHSISEDAVAYAFNTPTQIDFIMIYPTGNTVNGLDDIIVSFSDDKGDVVTKRISSYNVYTWCPVSINKKVSKFVFYTDGGKVTVGEIGFLAGDNVLAADSSVGKVFISGDNGFEAADSETGAFDEQMLVPASASYMNGMYFDEIFHARTAKEYIDDKPAYEWTHPPLGKILISVGIRIFGMNPLGWRFMSGVFGVLSVAVLYVFAKLVTKNSIIALASGLLMTFDFMHHVQSRIGTVDVFLVFFIMLMYMFLYMAFEKEKVRYLPLLLSGISFGLAFSVKWSAAYAVLGVGILLLLRIFKRGNTGIERTKLICFSAMAFALIPICIYIISYLPFVSADGKTGFEAIIENQMKILSYHGGESVELAHDFSSRWYTWAFDIKPVMYYSAWQDCETYGAIYAFGNPIIWWLGAAAVVLNVFLAVLKKDKKAVFLLTGYFSCLLPWILISRQTFIYHYYPCTVFMLLSIANCFLYIKERKNKTAYALCAVTVIFSASLFIMFLPVIRGTMANVTYIERFLSWLPDWNL